MTQHHSADFQPILTPTKIMESPTVFVLGAGASEPYNFPLGEVLMREIKSLADKIDTGGILMSLGFSELEIADFADTLKYGKYPTIDELLEDQNRFRKLGSHIIARIMMPKEKAGLLEMEDWYNDLFKALFFNQTQLDARQLSIVTLNYERSFEHFLSSSIHYRIAQPRKDEAYKKLAQIKVVHAHGSFGEYPEVKYGIKVDGDSLRNAAAGILIASDRLVDSPNYRKAQALIYRADHIVFLGFGYDKRILNALLATTELSKISKKIFYGTAVGIDEAMSKRLVERFGDKLTLGKGTQKCQQFLKHMGVT